MSANTLIAALSDRNDIGMCCSLSDRIQWEHEQAQLKAKSEFDQLSLQINDKSKLKEFLRICSVLALDQELIYETAVYIFDYFKDKPVLSHADIDHVKKKFAQSADWQFVDRIRSLVCELAVGVPNLAGNIELSKRKQFGSSIRFYYEPSREEVNDFERYQVICLGRKPSSSSNNKVTSKETATSNIRYDEKWLVEQLSGCTDKELMCKSVIDALLTNDPDNLQELLLDFLGFERIDLISSIITNQAGIIKNLIDDRRTAKIQSQLASATSKTGVPSQVIIKSTEEETILKQIKKSTKRKRQTERKAEEEVSRMVNFDPEILRLKRAEELIAAKSKPILPQKPKIQIPKYPYVFDALAEKLSAGFSTLKGSQLVLPANAVKDSKPGYERIHIPALEVDGVDPTMPPDDRVSLDSMDDLCRLLFSGVKQLNRIQSIVYPTAYTTNENLLICAPTGAGKTNVAMLAIAGEIKRNILDGNVEKDKFKIIYVAPMKALAAEMTENFGKRLSALGLSVRELTGDMQLTKRQIAETQMLVTTPEKWDVVTRKGTADDQLIKTVKLLIIDEIHLLHDDRGPVIECLVARTLRYAEQLQRPIRIIGLSATLPNYVDVALFLHVNPYSGLFFFDSRFRPVPLAYTFVGVSGFGKFQSLEKMDDACYQEVKGELRKDNQVLVFVHSRNSTSKTANMLLEMARRDDAFDGLSPNRGLDTKSLNKFKNRKLEYLVQHGLGIHHAGMPRTDRNIIEQYFRQGVIRVLVCTATLAWGVNLPAHAVIIKGTSIYDAKKSSYVDVGILDVLQIFGRAGRPQFDTSGRGVIITSSDKVNHYLSLIMRQHPIESNFISGIADSLNAEIVLGTVSTVEEGMRWLQDTYLYVRIRLNPTAYGLRYQNVEDDPTLEQYRKVLIVETAKRLEQCYMIRFDENNAYLKPTDLGRVASHFYISYATVQTINEKLHPAMNEAELLYLVSMASEFNQIKTRDEEEAELDALEDNECKLPVFGGPATNHGKANILIQSYISKAPIDTFSLQSDMNYVTQNSGRIARAIFHIGLKNNSPLMTAKSLNLCRMIERRMWLDSDPLRQIERIPIEVVIKMEQKRLTFGRLQEMNAREIGDVLHNMKVGELVKTCSSYIPCLDIYATTQPITRSVLRVNVELIPEFSWNDSVHGSYAEIFWLWVEDPCTDFMYHSQQVVLLKQQVQRKQTQHITFTIPISEPLPSQYIIRCMSDKWIGADTAFPLSFQHLILPDRHPPHTDLLDLDPLPLSALHNSSYESFYKFTHFNPIQTQVFHTLYHRDVNVLLGAPTGSGKTAAAEIAIFHLFNTRPRSKAVYIAPLKALVRERVDEWKPKFRTILNRSVVELTGDYTPDLKKLQRSDIIITTPEKWDGISRSWQTRTYVQSVELIIIDEIHLLGEDRGPVLEVIVSRANYIAKKTGKNTRVIGLSTAIANAVDLADWLNISKVGLYNFRPSVRPVPLEAHISGFPGEHYCPRMATMNKPCFQAIKTYSAEKPVLVFVSSRRQTRLTAFDLISLLAVDGNPKQWLHMPEHEMDSLVTTVQDTNLQLTLAFGIGMHHAGLCEKDRKVVEELFVNLRIQILIATSTLAWGVNFPAHLVVIKGTEYFDGKVKKYVDFPITDVLQMMGRAGRPQFDNQGVAVIMVQDSKKDFYKKFLYEPFPVESCLLSVLPDHFNAEIVSGTIRSKQDAIDYITWTYFFRRLMVNPSFYGLEEVKPENLNAFLSHLVDQSLTELCRSHCVAIDEDDRTVFPTTSGRIASFYYVSHSTIRTFKDTLRPNLGLEELLRLLSDAHEYEELPVRHNEDEVCAELAKHLPMSAGNGPFDSPHTKTFLLLQAHFERIELPVSDFRTDTKSVLDQVQRVLQAMLDLCAEAGWLSCCLHAIHIMQMANCGQWIYQSSLLQLPGIQHKHVGMFERLEKFEVCPSIHCLPEMIECFGQNRRRFQEVFAQPGLTDLDVTKVYDKLSTYPVVELSFTVTDEDRTQTAYPIDDDESTDDHRIQIKSGRDYVFQINAIRLNKIPYTTRERKSAESWIIILAKGMEVLALRRIMFPSTRMETSIRLAFRLEESSAIRGNERLQLFWMSASVIGLDQQFDFRIDV